MNNTSNLEPAPAALAAPLAVAPPVADGTSSLADTGSGPGPAARLDPPAAPSFFPRLPGETPRAFAAFMAYFELGPARSLASVAGQLAESLDTVKRWSHRHRWSARLADFQASLLQQSVAARFALHREQAGDWARRNLECREQEWDCAQKLRAAAQCFLETFDESQVEKMSLSQVSRAIQVAARLARQALADAPQPETASRAPIQLEIEAALQKAFGPSADSLQHPEIRIPDEQTQK